MYAFVAAALVAAQPVMPPEAAAASSPPAITSAEPAPACCVLPKLTPVLLKIDEPVESDKARIGQHFALSLSRPLEVSAGLVIPAGTKGVGEVVHAAKSRAMGKAGELLLAARYLDWNGTRIPLRSFKLGKGQGQDNADTAAIVGIAVSAVVAPFITGGEIRIPAGTDAWAKVSADVAFPPPPAASAAAESPAAAADVPATTSNQGGEK